MRTTTVLFTLFAAAILSLTACGGGGDDGDDSAGDDDSAGTPDAMSTVVPDADTQAGKSLGASCTPDATDPTGPGDCGTGMTCLGGIGGTGPYCTKLCTPNDQDPFTECDALLTGPGRGACALDVSDSEHNPIGRFCVIVCEGPAQLCSDCDSTCPDNYLECTATEQQGVSACQ